MSERKYYYSKLTDKEKHICDLVVDAVRGFEKSIRFYFHLNENSFSRVFDVIQKNYPDIFYLDIENTKMIISGLIATVHLAYLYPTSVIRKHQERIDKITNTILSPTIMGRDKLEIEIRIHELLLRNVDYSPELTNIESYSIVGPLLNTVQEYVKDIQKHFNCFVKKRESHAYVFLDYQHSQVARQIENMFGIWFSFLHHCDVI